MTSLRCECRASSRCSANSRTVKSCSALFRRICELVPIIATSKPGDDKQAEAKLARQLEDLLRGMPSNPVVDGILQEIGGSTGAVEIEVVTEIFHIAGRDNTSLREGLSTEAREALRNYLNAAMPTVLAQDDFNGQLKGYFATVIAQVGELSDLAAIEHLVEADIERVRTGRLARAADHRNKQGNGVVMSWTGWYVQAMIHLASDASQRLVIRLLTAPDYEHDAAWGLFQLALGEHASSLLRPRGWPMRSKDFSLIWKARAGEAESIFIEPGRTEIAAVLRRHIETLVVERAADPEPAGLNGRLKHLAIVLAEFDGQASAELVLEILSYPQIERSRPRTTSRIRATSLLVRCLAPHPRTRSSVNAGSRFAVREDLGDRRTDHRTRPSASLELPGIKPHVARCWYCSFH